MHRAIRGDKSDPSAEEEEKHAPYNKQLLFFVFWASEEKMRAGFM